MSDPGRSNRHSGSDPVQSVARALELLDVLQRQESATISELAELQGVHRATTLRLLQTLERFGYVTRGEHRGEFRLGLKLYEMGAVYAERSDLLQAARPMMRHLALKTGETIDLALYHNDATLLIESIAARPGVRVGSDIGRRSSPTCTTTGKLHFAALPWADVEQMLAIHGLPRLGPKSITDPQRFHAELERVRSNGYAVNDEETDPDVRFVGVRIKLPGDRSTPSLILGAPKHRLSLAAIPGVATMLADAAEQIAGVA